MKYQEGSVGNKGDFAEYIKKMVPELFSGRLAVEGKTVIIPHDKDLDYKVKYDIDEAGGSVSVKVAWDNDNGEDEEEVEVDVD